MGIVNAVIGALRVNLGLDSAEFENGVKRNQDGLKGLLVGFTVDIGGVAEKVGDAFKAIPEAISGVIDSNADLGHLAEKIGVPVEQLSQLEYAAKLSDVSVDSLTGGLKALDKNLLSVAVTGSGPAANAFAALGISVNDLNGHLKSSSEVFAEIATKFAGMEDGATKTALGIALMGRSAQDLIPLLNESGSGLKEMADQADAFGNTVSAKAAFQSIEFNDDLQTMGTRLDGVKSRITDGVLPSLVFLANNLKDATGQADLWNGAAALIVGGFKNIETAAIATGAQFANIVGHFAELGDVVTAAGGGHFDQLGSIIAADDQKLKNLADNTDATLKGVWASFDNPSGGKDSAVGDAADAIRKKLGEMDAEQAAVAAARAASAAADDKAFAGDMTKAQGRIAALQAQTTAQAALNPLVTDYGAAVAAAQMAQQLENDAAEHHIALSPALQAQIDAEAEQWGKATAASNELAAAQALTVQRTEGLRDASKDVLSGFIDDLEQGKSLLQDLGDILGTVGKDLISSGLNSLLNSKAQGGSGVLDGVFSGIASMLHFADGGAGVVGGAGGRDSQLFTAMVTPGEPYAFGDDALNGIAPKASVVSAPSFNFSIDARGAQMGAGADIVKQLKQALPGLLIDMRRRGQIA